MQLLAPLTPDSPIGKFLERSGPGLQQVAYRVDDIEAVSATLRERGLRLLYDEPRRGTAGARINFVHPKDAGGVLLELVQPPDAQPTRVLSTATIRPPEADMQPMQQIIDAINSGDASSADFAALEVPESLHRGTPPPGGREDVRRHADA